MASDLTAQALYDLYYLRLSKLGAWPDSLVVQFVMSAADAGPRLTHDMGCILRCAAIERLCTDGNRPNGIHIGKYGANPEGTGLHWVVEVAARRMNPTLDFENESLDRALCAALDAVIQEKDK